jgi:hypothetical protein
MAHHPPETTAVIVRPNRTIQYAAASRSIAGAGDDWMPAFAGMTTENVEGN